eukprot:gene15140-18314_t
MFPVLLFWSSILFANDVKVTASVSKTEVAVGEAFEITFTVNGNAERFDPPSFAGFQVISGPNQSSSMTSINGNTTVSMSLSYDLVGTQEGEYTIGAGSIVVNGKVYKSNALKIKVVKGNPAQSSSQSRAAARGRTQTNVQTVTGNAADVAKNLFIKASVNKTNPYQGEQLTVSYKLYTNVNLVDNSLDKLPDFNGFWSQEIKNTNPNVEWAIEKIKGVSYHVATLKQIILFPERSGNLVLDPLAMTFLVRQAAPSMDIFDQFFGGSYKDTKYKISSAPVNIHVRPLPENGKPVGFQGAVGQFSVQASLDKTQLKANEALNYSLKISGTGNLKLLNAPTVNFPADVEKHEGSYTIEPFQFSYFNPVSGKYVSLPSRAFQIKVSKGDPGANVTAYSGNQQDIKMLNKDIMYIKTTDLALSENGKNFYGSLGYVLSMLLGPALFGLAWWSKKRYEEKNKDLVQVKWRKANKIAARHLAFAAKQLAAGDQKAFYEAIYKGLYGYLSDKLNISAAELNIEHIRTSLRAININEELIGRLGNTLELCEMARYAPVPGSTEQEVFDQSKSIINDIETHAAGDRPSDWFAKGNEQYAKARYEQALEAYQKVEQSGYSSAAFNFNLGNTYYKLGNMPAAILNYERAYRLAPSDKDIDLNLKLARLKITDKIDEVPELFLLSWWKNFLFFFSLSQLSIGSIVLFIMGFLLLSFYLFAPSSTLKKAAFFSGLGLALIGFVFMLMAGAQSSYFNRHQQAIVFSSSVQLANGNTGWIEASVVQKI